MSNLQAAVGVAEMERLPETLAKKRQIGAWYEDLLRDLKGVERLPSQVPFAENIYWVYGLVLKETEPFEAGKALSGSPEWGLEHDPSSGRCMRSG